LHDAQKKITEKESKSRIPQGLFKSIWNLWIEALDTEDGFQELCSKCGDPRGEMMCCDSEGCGRVEHHDCQSTEEIPLEIKAEKWFCQNCRLKNQIEAAMLDYTDMTGTSRPGVFLTAPYGEQDA
jgi:hypothetical protein